MKEGGNIDLFILVLKCVLIYFTILIVLRFMGKREVGQLSLFDLAVVLLMADILSAGIGNQNFPIYYYLIGIIILSLIQKLIAHISMKDPSFRQFVEGKQSIIIYNGKINIEEMRRQKYNIDDLIVQLRLKDISSISEVNYAILETNGQISVFKKDALFPFPIIVSGKIIEENLKLLNLSKRWVFKNLKDYKLKNVMYASYEEGKLVVVDCLGK